MYTYGTLQSIKCCFQLKRYIIDTVNFFVGGGGVGQNLGIYVGHQTSCISVCLWNSKILRTLLRIWPSRYWFLSAGIHTAMYSGKHFSYRILDRKRRLKEGGVRRLWTVFAQYRQYNLCIPRKGNCPASVPSSYIQVSVSTLFTTRIGPQFGCSKIDRQILEI